MKSKYVIKFSILTKNMKVTLEAESGSDAVKQLKDLVKIHDIEKIEPERDKGFENIKKVFGDAGIWL